MGRVLKRVFTTDSAGLSSGDPVRLTPGAFIFLLFTLYNCIVSMGFLPKKIRVAFPGESQLRHSRATRPRVHAGCFSVSTIHRTLT